MMLKKKGAFSLTEVLVVIVIIAILASLFMPAAGGAKRASWKVVCASNMRQVFLAMKLYEDDYGSFPPGSVVWPAFQPYYPTVLKCPASPAESGEFDYLMMGGPIGGVAGFDAALQECLDIRGGDFPLVRDKNHIVRTNMLHPESRLFLLRGNGAFSSVHPEILDGPCKSILGFDSNL